MAMTNLKSNDFSEGFLEFDEGMKLTFKNLDTGARAEFDGDTKTVLEVINTIRELIQNKLLFYQKWVMPNEGNDIKFGRFQPYDTQWIEVTIKNMEIHPPTYVKFWIKQEDMLMIMKDYSLKPRWKKRIDGVDTPVAK